MGIFAILFISMLHLSRVMTQNIREEIFHFVGNVNADSLLGYPVYSHAECAMLCTSNVTCIGLVLCEDSTSHKTCLLYDGTNLSGQFENDICEMYIRASQINDATVPNAKEADTTTEPTTTAEVTTEATTTAEVTTETTTTAEETTTMVTMTCQNGGTPASPCDCPAGTTGVYCETRLQDCKDVADHVSTTTATYTIWPTNSATSFDVECSDFTNYGIQMMYRHTAISGCTITTNPVTYLDTPWSDYKSGFSDSNCYMWLGLEKIYAITSSKSYKLVMNIVNAYDDVTVATYSSFSIGDESSEYRLSVSGFSGQGNIGDRFNIGEPADTIDGSNFCAKVRCVTSGPDCSEWGGGGWWQRQDKCQSHPHNQWGIEWEIADGTPSTMKDMVMWLVPA